MPVEKNLKVEQELEQMLLTLANAREQCKRSNLRVAACDSRARGSARWRRLGLANKKESNFDSNSVSDIKRQSILIPASLF
jgi:hypothetical protein